MVMKVHVTGAGGFIGSILCAELRRQGHESSAGIAGADLVVHLAGVAHRRASAEEIERVNVQLTERIGRKAAAAGAHLVFLSSVKVYGETSASPLREDSPLAPGDAYGASKVRAEGALARIDGLSCTVLRPPLVYGPGVKANFLALLRAIDRGWPLPLGAIRNRRSLIYVGNLTDVILRCAGVCGTFVVSDGPGVSTAELCREIAAALGRPARLFPFPPALLPGKLAASLEVDDRAIRERLGWRPPYTREQGLRATTDWYRRR